MVRSGAGTQLIVAAVRKVPLILLLTLLALLAFAAFSLVRRYIQECRGVGAVETPDVANSVWADEPLPATEFSRYISYTSIAAPDWGRVSSCVDWDDGWFFGDADEYNHELAHTCSVIAALAYSESGYYQNSVTQPPYMEDALAKLGFSEVSTESYRYRSEVVDEVLNLFTDDSDAVAYTIARKHLVAPSTGASSEAGHAGEKGEGGVASDPGEPARDLILVSIRGSYGSEWLSNLNLLPASTPNDSGASSDESGTSVSEDAGQVSSDADVTSSSGSLATLLKANPAFAKVHEELSRIGDPIGYAFTSWLEFAQTLSKRSSEGEAPAETPMLDGEVHSGYLRAAQEVADELDRWIEESHSEGAEVSVLVVGHSRGGAIANLVAANLDERIAEAAGEGGLGTGESDFDAGSPSDAESASKGEDSPASGELSRTAESASSNGPVLSHDSVFAYTFASPATTLASEAHEERFANIFNIVNPSDIMPYLPLSSWGYKRFGVDAYLPSVGDDGFEEEHERMRTAFKRTVGVESPYDPEDKVVIERMLDEVSEKVATAHDLMTPAGVASVVTTALGGFDPVRVLYGHYPSTYIAWMEASDSSALDFSS